MAVKISIHVEGDVEDAEGTVVEDVAAAVVDKERAARAMGDAVYVSLVRSAGVNGAAYVDDKEDAL